MSFCKNCGKELPEGSNFCLNCGTPVSDNVFVNKNNYPAGTGNNVHITVEHGSYVEQDPTQKQADGSGKIGKIISVILFILALIDYFSDPPLITIILSVIIIATGIFCLIKRYKLKGFCIASLVLAVWCLSLGILQAREFGILKTPSPEEYSVSLSNKQKNFKSDEEDNTKESSVSEVLSTSETTQIIWSEYVPEDDFGDKRERTKNDPQFSAAFNGTCTTTVSINPYDTTMGVEINDHSFYDAVGEAVYIIPITKVGTIASFSISDEGYVKAKASGGKKLEGETHYKSGVFFFDDPTRYFTEHLKAGEDIQVVLNTKDGTYKFKFTMSSANFKSLHDEVSSKLSDK